MRKGTLILLSVILAIFGFNEKEIYKKDIRNRLVIQGIGIDMETDGLYTVTLQAIDTNAQTSVSSDGASEPPVRVYKVRGNTIYTAMKSVIETEGKSPLYSQNRIIILGKSVIKENMEDVIDFFVRDVENGASIYIAAAENTAAEILKAKAGEEYVTARTISSTIGAYEYDARIFGTQIYGLINRYNSGTKDFAIPLLSVTEYDGKQNVEIIGTALFNKTRYADYITKDDTIYLNILFNKLYNTAISFDSGEGTEVSLNIVKSDTVRKVCFENGKPLFKINVKMTADISEISGGVSSAMNKNEINSIESGAENYIERQLIRVQKILHEETESDACGFARLLYIFKPTFYRGNEKNIDSVLKNSVYEIDVQVKIRRIGHEFVEIS